MRDDSGSRTVEISAELIDRVRDRIEHTEFDSETEYIEYVLEEVLHHVTTEFRHTTVKEVDEADVEEKLKSLGYLTE